MVNRFAQNKQGNRFGGGGGSRFGNQYDTGSVNRQIENAETRIRYAGFEPKEDNRNWFEKATNLPEGQNFFFDTLDLLDRPGNAIRTAIDGGGDDLGDSLWKGFSGQVNTRGTDILDNLGVDTDNKVVNGVLGFGAEVLTDPTMLIPGGVFAKGLRTGANATKKAFNVMTPQSIQRKIEPALEGTKNTFNAMFNTRHGRNQQFDSNGRLVKGDDKLTPMIQETQNRIDYQNTQNMNNILKAAKNAGGYKTGSQVGRIMEDSLQQFDEAGNLIPRNKMELPDDPELKQAAAELMRGNDLVRNQARELGINVNELQGYMRHILSKEERKRRRELGESVYNVDRGNFGIGNPNDKFLKQRKYTGSAEEINRDAGRNVFESNAYFATAYGQKQLTEYMNAVDFRRKVLSDPSLAIKYQKGMNVPEGTTKINTKNYQFMKDEDLAEMGMLDEVGGEYVVPHAVKTALDKFQRLTTDEGMRGFLKAFDTAQSWWKRAALFSLPYHVRNDVGAKFNNYVGGMNAMDIAKYSSQADKEVYQAMVLGKPSQMFDEFLQQGLGANSQSKIEFARMGDDAAQELERLVKNESKTGGERLAGKILRPFETSRQFGDFIDQTNRYAAYKWAREKKKMSPEQAASKVRQTQFDYNNLTNFEREFMTRLVPFYRWMRNNIPYQMKQFANDPRKFIRVDDFRRNMQSSMGINEENIPDWMTEQFAIPVTGEDDGSGQFVSMNLPVGDLTRVADPGKTFVDSLSPFAKLPIELTLNRNFFYNNPIESYEGQQRQMNIPGTDVNFGLPAKQAYALENLTGQIGRNAFDYLQRPGEENQDTKFRTPSLGISSMLKEYDVVKSEYYERLNELQRLQDRINWIEQQTGMRPPTMNEINQNRPQSRFGGVN
ncbi:hypothetical protein [Ornithinibacillus xuwenensis]|uniref:Large polyvalent protein associated domain-containing protein n=1 Tax=Ornithinibacillus xuwenensis TaxID=3144668 RepID=A0ABU9XBY7_9BACI